MVGGCNNLGWHGLPESHISNNSYGLSGSQKSKKGSRDSIILMIKPASAKKGSIISLVL